MHNNRTRYRSIQETTIIRKVKDVDSHWPGTFNRFNLPGPTPLSANWELKFPDEFSDASFVVTVCV